MSSLIEALKLDHQPSQICINFYDALLLLYTALENPHDNCTVLKSLCYPPKLRALTTGSEMPLFLVYLFGGGV